MSYRRNHQARPYRKYSRGRGSGDYDRERGHREFSGPKRYEDWAWQLDFLSHGYMDDPRPKHLRDPIVQVIGEKYFSLLDVIVDRDMAYTFDFKPRERVFIGKGEENKLGHRFKRIFFDKLTITAKGELPKILEEIISNNPERFLNFFNNSQPITNRMHQLELLPGIGKKTMWAIIDARKRKKFESFEDIQERTSVAHPKVLIVKRIMKELEDREEKHLIFVRN
ncbi:MAG: DUF655 domain-containing protein [Promethearchaeota archaeon]